MNDARREAWSLLFDVLTDRIQEHRMNTTDTKGRWQLHQFGKKFVVRRVEDDMQFSFRKKSRALNVGQQLTDGTMTFAKARELEALDKLQYA